MIQYFLKRLPAILLVFSFLIILHQLQIRYGFKGVAIGDSFVLRPVENYVVVFITSNTSQINKSILSKALTQTRPAASVIWIDTAHETNPFPELNINYKKTSTSQIVKTLIDSVKTFKGRSVVVQFDPHQQNVHERILERLDRVFKNQSVWLVYSDNRLYPSKLNPKWCEAGLKAFDVHLLEHIDQEASLTVEQFYKNLFCVGNGHHHFTSQILDPAQDTPLD